MHGLWPSRIGPRIRGAAITSALTLTLACDLDPGSDSGDDDSGASTGGSGDVDAGSENPTAATGTDGGAEGSFTGVDPTDGATSDSTTADPDTGGEDEGPGSESTGDPGDPGDLCDLIERDCATFDGGDLVLFELVSGTIIDTIPVPLETLDAHSITWVGDHVYACVGQPQTLHRIDTTTGIVTDGGIECTGVTDSQGSLLVRRGSFEDIFSTDYAYYADFASVQANTPSVVTNYPPDIERFTATDDTLVSTWHSDDHFAAHDLPTAAPLGDVTLDGHDGWFMGLEVVEGQLVIGTWFSEPMRHVAFDLATGARTCELPSLGGGDPLNFGTGLACARPQAAPPPPPPPA